VGALGCVRSHRRGADWSCRAGEGLGSTSGRGEPVLDVKRSRSGWGNLLAFRVVRSKAGAREGASELEAAGAGVRGAAGRREESGHVSITLGSSCSWVEGPAGGGAAAWELSVAGVFPRVGTGLAEQSLSPAEWSSSQLDHRGGEATQQLRTGRSLPPFGQDGLEHRCSDLGWLPAQNGQITGFLHLGLTWPNLQQLRHWVEGDDG